MADFTKCEVAAINAAWRSIAHLCDCTNWTDAGEWRAAEREERQQAPSDSSQRSVWARAMICKAWADGLDNPDKPARQLFHIRAGYLRGFMLGVRHRCERADTEYNGPMVAEARDLCTAAIAANDAHTRRIVEG